MIIKSVEKAVAVLNCFAVARPVLGVNDIARATGFTKSTASRLLATLEHTGCVKRAGEVGRYTLGPTLHFWGGILSRQAGLPTIARPVMEALRDATGEEVALYVMQGDSRICLEKIESVHEVAKVSLTGTLLPMHCGAAGKVLLAWLPEEQRRRIISSGPLRRYTAHTVTDPEALEHDLAEIRRRGYGVSMNEREIGAYSVVAPVRDATGAVVASLALSGPTFRLGEGQLDELTDRVVEAAREISARLGHA